jgi:hypothetical protein
MDIVHNCDCYTIRIKFLYFQSHQNIFFQIIEFDISSENEISVASLFLTIVTTSLSSYPYRKD